MRTLFTSESVTEGHPDKICDQISDAVLDAILEKDPDARVACECATTTGLVKIINPKEGETVVVRAKLPPIAIFPSIRLPARRLWKSAMTAPSTASTGNPAP